MPLQDATDSQSQEPPLSPIVPAFRLHPDMAMQEVGMLQLYNRQLQHEMTRRANEANDLHDEVLALREQVEPLRAEVLRLEVALDDLLAHVNGETVKDYAEPERWQ